MRMDDVCNELVKSTIDPNTFTLPLEEEKNFKNDKKIKTLKIHYLRAVNLK